MLQYNLFDDFFSELAAPTWSRSFKEKDAYKIVPELNKEGDVVGCTIAFNTVGVNPKDLKVKHTLRVKERDPRELGRHSCKELVLQVSGTTDISELKTKYSCDYNYAFEYDKDIEDVQYKCKDGLTFIFIKFKKPIVEAEKSEDTTELGENDVFKW